MRTPILSLRRKQANLTKVLIRMRGPPPHRNTPLTQASAQQPAWGLEAERWTGRPPGNPRKASGKVFLRIGESPTLYFSQQSKMIQVREKKTQV